MKRKRTSDNDPECHGCQKPMPSSDKKTPRAHLDQKTFCSFECAETWYDTCLECGDTKPRHCKCTLAGRTCKNGHEWHQCLRHNLRMPGSGHGAGGTCHCVLERKARPTDEEMLDFLRRKHKLSIKRQLNVLLGALETNRRAVTRLMHKQPLDASESESDSSLV